MKTMLVLFLTLILAAASATALAMPCGKTAHLNDEVQDARHQVRLHVAQAPAPFKLPGQTVPLPI